MRILALWRTLPARLAAELNRRTQYWNKQSKLLVLVMLILLLGGGSLYLFCKAIWFR